MEKEINYKNNTISLLETKIEQQANELRILRRFIIDFTTAPYKKSLQIDTEMSYCQ